MGPKISQSTKCEKSTGELLRKVFLTPRKGLQKEIFFFLPLDIFQVMSFSGKAVAILPSA